LDPSDLIGLLDVIDLLKAISCHHFFLFLFKEFYQRAKQ